MTEPEHEPQGGFDSRDCVNWIVDVWGDTTVRPIRKALLEHALKERAKLVKYGKLPPLPGEEPTMPEANGS